MPAYQAKKNRSPAQVLADIEAGKVEPVYLLFGQDSASADDIIAALRHKLIEPGFEAFDFESIHAEDADITLTLQHVNQPPMASKRRLVVVRGLDRLERKHAAAEFCAGVAKTPDFATVAVTCEYDAAYVRLFNSAGVAKYVVNLYQPYPEDLVLMLRRWAKDRSLDLTAQAAALLCEIAGTDTALLKSEVDKLAASVGRNGRATAETVRELASNSREYTLNEYVRHVEHRDAKRALTVLRRLQEWGEQPIKIIGWLAPVLIRQAGERSGDELTRLNRALHELYDINRQIVTGFAEPYLLLETFTICLVCDGRNRACQLAGRANPPEFCLRVSRTARRRAANE